ncbi:hypothetical protein ACWDE9_28900 [Streptomyces olivaceoviridis]
MAGARTGGAYLAPLVAARLEPEGVDVRVTSVRPGETPEAEDRRVLLVDDPPLTGRTLLSVAQNLSGPGGVEVLVPVFDAAEVRGLRKAGIAVTVLPRAQWQSTCRLEPDFFPPTWRRTPTGWTRAGCRPWTASCPAGRTPP